MSRKNNDLLDEYTDTDDEGENALKADMPIRTGTLINLDARRRLEEYQDQRELARLIRDEFDFLDELG